jgi:hypothetical protein
VLDKRHLKEQQGPMKRAQSNFFQNHTTLKKRTTQNLTWDTLEDGLVIVLIKQEERKAGLYWTGTNNS